MSTVGYDIVILGGGISGLSAAAAVHEENLKSARPAKFALFEAGERLGGHIETVRKNGFLIEKGPDCFIAEKKGTLDFIRRLGLEEELVGTSRENRRSFVVHKKKLYPLPQGFYYIAPVKILPFLKTPLLSLKGKLRAGLELFVPPKKDTEDESVLAFIERRFGREAFDNLIQPMISGVYSGDPETLSAGALLERFRRLERDSGSVIRGLRSRGKKHREEASAAGPRYGLFLTFKDGLSRLTERIAERLPEGTKHLKKRAVKILKPDGGGAWQILFDDRSSVAATNILLTLPAYISAALLKEAAPDLSDELLKIPYESVATLQWGYPRRAIGHPLNGFGFVVPRKENLSLIGCSFSSKKFSSRASRDQCLIRAFAGGAFGKERLLLGDEELERRVRRELEGLLSIRGAGVLLDIQRHPDSMPQYQVGHAALVERIDQKAHEAGGLTFLGSAFRGMGISACIEDAQRYFRS